MGRWLIDEQTTKKPTNLYVVPERVMGEGAGDTSSTAASEHSLSHRTTSLPTHPLPQHPPAPH